MNPYFPSALAMASNNTDSYVGKTWIGVGDEQTSLGQFRITRMEGSVAPSRVVCDFAGEATYTPSGGGVSATYDSGLRRVVVGALKWEPGITVAAENATLNIAFAFVQAVDSNQQAGIFERNVGSSAWYASTTFASGPAVDYSYKMFIHESANRRGLLLNSFNARYTNANPSLFGTTWTLATTYNDGFAKYGYANKTGITTAVGVDGRVRYTTDGVNWLGTVIPSATGTTLQCAAWSGDGTVCLAAGNNGVLATSTDGQTFALSTDLQTTPNWGTRRAAAMAADPSSGAVLFVVCGDGTVAKTNDYGVTWTAVNNLFSVNQRYDGNSVEATPITCWVEGTYLYVSIYGGQVVRVSVTLGSSGDISNDFNQYSTSFGTPDVKGNYVPAAVSPSGTVRALFAGGLGRLRYVTSSGPFGSPYDLGLMQALINQGYNNNTVCSAYYDEGMGVTFVGLSNGLVAYRFNPFGAGSWQFFVFPGSVGDVVGFARVPFTNTILAVEQSGYTATGVASGFTISWLVSSDLRSAIFPRYTTKVATDDFSYVVVSLDERTTARTTDGSTWTLSTLPATYPGAVPNPKVNFDPRANNGFGSGLFLAFYQDIFTEYAASSFSGSGWVSQSIGAASGATDNLPTGTFTFGSPAVTIGIRPNGSGVITTTPSSPSAWGTTSGLINRNTAVPLPAFHYYPTTGVLFTGGTITNTNTGYATGKYGRFWFSIIL